jgi:zinc transport system substrate-binding protein
MKNLLKISFLFLLMSCNTGGLQSKREIVTVSISPFKYFVKAIGGEDFEINVMVPASADPHIYEPVPEQILSLRKSLAYISDGYLGFEMTWLDRFYETNRSMKKLSLGDNIDLIKAGEHSEGDHLEGADPHYWVSPECAIRMAASVKELLCSLKPENSSKYEQNYTTLLGTITGIDLKAKELLTEYKGKSFMIFHPALGYFAREYGLNQIAVEAEGKEPTPSKMKGLIDSARKNDIRVILVQKGFDMKNANAIASEIGAKVKVVDPLSEDWQESMLEVINSIHDSFTVNSK